MALMRNQKPKKEKVKVLRPFFAEGEKYDYNDVAEFDAPLAHQLVNDGKASFDLDEKAVVPAWIGKVKKGVAVSK
ncbi:MAG: hypothetical protein D6800_12440 [Candidatus Zixiibacteriota bacterium]|nr:MAG: hypothetical protein D6800_12440 [candidate division Zixibacteria bacterium]